jgi:hypothetical protein
MVSDGKVLFFLPKSAISNRPVCYLFNKIQKKINLVKYLYLSTFKIESDIYIRLCIAFIILILTHLFYFIFHK